MSKWIVDIHGDIEGDYDIVAKIPDNATNGDVIKTMFPNAEISIDNEVVTVLFDGYEYSDYWEGWWNAPYKENKDGTDNNI